MSNGNGQDMNDVDPVLDQSAHRVRFEWGTAGARAVRGDVAVLVDVLSFSTILTVAVERGIEVFPFEWRDTRATSHALKHGASLAVARHEARTRADARHVSISPSALQESTGIERLVVPHFEGASLAFQLLEDGATVIAGSLRNADAVAEHVVRVADALGRRRSVVFIAAGEVWPDGTLRPSVEDLWGVGAIIAGLAERGLDDLSVEARTALGAYLAVEGDVREALHQCGSGRALVAEGFSADVDLAGQVSASTVVPLLRGESFGPATS